MAQENTPKRENNGKAVFASMFLQKGTFKSGTVLLRALVYYYGFAYCLRDLMKNLNFVNTFDIILFILAVVAFLIGWKNKYPKNWFLFFLMVFLPIIGFPCFIYSAVKHYAVLKGLMIEEQKDWKFWLAVVLMSLLCIVGLMATYVM